MALNVALYGKGMNRWTMTERGINSLSQSKDRLSIGPSNLHWDGNDLVIEITEWTVPIPRRVRGSIRVSAAALTEKAFNLDGHGHHYWQPIAPKSRVEVTFDKPGMNWTGDAYLDSNWGTEPLENGFKYWNWSRASLKDGAGIYYDSMTRDGDARQLALRFDGQGRCQELSFPDTVEMPAGRIWRVDRQTPFDNNLQPRTVSVLEDTPFYTRSKLDSTFDGERVTAIHESLDLDRFSKNWVKCLLPFRMPRKA